jgi:hypothetical protein
MIWRNAAVAAVAALAVGLALASSASARHEVGFVRSGDVLATLSYDVDHRDVYRNIRLQIERAGTTVLSAAIPSGCAGCPLAGPAGEKPLRVQDLDGDAEPEVLLDMFTGGAHCCTYTYAYRFRADVGTYTRMRASWGNAGYRLVDLDHDGRPELSSFDDRFAYAFAPYAYSVDPIRIWRYAQGRLIDVTRTFRRLVARDARRQLLLYRKARRSRYREVRGVLAAYVADEYLLGRPSVGWRLVRSALRRGELRATAGDPYPGGRRYVAALRRFLRRTGYAH